MCHGCLLGDKQILVVSKKRVPISSGGYVWFNYIYKKMT